MLSALWRLLVEVEVPDLVYQVAWEQATPMPDKKLTAVDSSSLLPTYSDYSFEEQIEDNVSQSLSFSLSIPLLTDGKLIAQ